MFVTTAPTSSRGGNATGRGAFVPTVAEEVDLEYLIKFPAAPGSEPPAAGPKKFYVIPKELAPLPEIRMNFSTKPTTAHICWIQRRAKALAAAEHAALNPGGPVVRVRGNIRRRAQKIEDLPKRPYNWKSDMRNKSETYARNGHTGRHRDHQKVLNDAERLMKEALEAADAAKALVKNSRVGSRRKRTREDRYDTDQEESEREETPASKKRASKKAKKDDFIVDDDESEEEVVYQGRGKRAANPEAAYDPEDHASTKAVRRPGRGFVLNDSD